MHAQRMITIVALTALMPFAAASAQRGIMGGRGALPPGRGPGGVARAGVQIPKYVNSVNLLIEHRQDLALSDSQFARFIAAKRTLDSTNAPLLRKLDSVQRLFKNNWPMFGSPTAQRRDSLAEAHSFVAETMADVRDNITRARDMAYAFLSSLQLTKAQEFEGKAEKAAAEENQRNERAASRGGGLSSS